MGERALSKASAETVTQRSTLADGTKCFRTSKFTQLVTLLAPGIVLVTGIGYNSGASAPLVTEEVERAIPAQGKVLSFVNLSLQTGQASAAREWWIEWSKQHRPRIEGVHILVRSRIMDMAISVIRMFVGGLIHSHSEPESFEAAIRERVPSFQGLPTFPDLPPLRD